MREDATVPAPAQHRERETAVIEATAQAGVRHRRVRGGAWLTPNRAVLIVVMVAACVRFLMMGSLPLIVTPDSMEYIGSAIGLLRHGTVNLNEYRTPGYPIVLAAVFLLFGVGPFGILLTQHAVGILISALVTAMAIRLATPSIGLAVGLLTCVDPWFLLLSNYALTETAFTLSVIGPAAWIVLRRQPRPRMGLVLGAALGAACLIRPTAQVLVPFYAAAWVVRMRRGWRGVVAGLCAVAVGGALVVSPWVHYEWKRGVHGLARGSFAFFWGTAMFGMLDPDYIQDAATRHAYQHTIAREISDHSVVTFCWETDCIRSVPQSRLLQDWVAHSIARQPVVYLRNIWYALLWLLNCGFEGRPPIYDELPWFAERLLIDGTTMGQDAPNFQGARLGFPKSETFVMAVNPRGPLPSYFRWWAAGYVRGWPHIPLFLATAIATALAFRTRRWHLALLFLSVLAFVAAHAVMLLVTARYTVPLLALSYVAFAFAVGAWVPHRARALHRLGIDDTRSPDVTPTNEAGPHGIASRMSRISGRRFTVGLLLALTVGLCAAYSNSFTIGFQFDDAYLIPANSAIRSLRNIPSFFYDPFTFTAVRENADLRPILQITYALNYAISGRHPWSYHLLSLLLHFLTSALVFVIVRDHVWWPPGQRGACGEARLPAAGAALLFALAPLNSSMIDYMSARSALLCTALYLTAFLCFLRRRPVLTGLFHALALLTKAIAVTLPVTILAYDFIYRDRERYPRVIDYLRDWKRLAPWIILPVVLDIAYLLYRYLLLPPWLVEVRKQPFTTPLLWFMSQWSAYLYYVRLFLWPDALSIDHDFPYAFSFLQTRAWLPLGIILLWIGAALRWSRQFPAVAFATLWFFLTLAPESTFAPLAEVVNEHRPYIASALGLSVLVVWLLDRACRCFGPYQRTGFAAICIGLCVAAIPVTRHRNWQWQDPLRLWVDATQKGPGNGRAWMNAGLEFMHRGDFVSARRYFERARELAPNYAYVYINLSVLESHLGRLPEALGAAQRAVRLQPDLALSHYYLGLILEKLGRADEAIAAYRRSLSINPRDENAQQALSALEPTADWSAAELLRAGEQALSGGNDPDRAVTYFRRVLRKDPTNPAATRQLAVALDAAAMPEEARRMWEKVLSTAEREGDAATALAARERLARGEQPDDAVLMQRGLKALYTEHDPETAIAEFRAVLQHTPTHYGATYQLAAAFDAAGQRDQARPLWEKVRAMADHIGDGPTADTARRRLQQPP